MKADKTALNMPLTIEQYFRERIIELQSDINKLSQETDRRLERIEKRLEVQEKHWIVASTLGGVGMFITGVLITIASKLVGK